MRSMRRPSPRSIALLLAACLITAYGALLRLDALVGKYGTLDSPAWARLATQSVAPLAVHVRPDSVRWWREERPYLGGDPVNYLRFAREMKSFYQAHVREPIFLVVTKGALWATKGQDLGLSFSSLLGSVAAIVAAFLLTRRVAGPAAGLLAALLMAIEYEQITWAPDGWRDDTFTATLLFAAWGIVRLVQDRTVSAAAIAGLLCGVACLTRLTALSVVLPALLYACLVPDGTPRRQRLPLSGIALLVTAGVLGPYLVNCWLVTGDPLYAANYHTAYYRYSEGMPSSEPMSAFGYIREKFASRPVTTTDTAFMGLVVQPFLTKWNGYAPWSSWLGPTLQLASLAGMSMMVFSSTGRLLLVMLVCSLVPYAFTWNIAGGREWRFTMHAYPFYLVAAAHAVVSLLRSVGGLARGVRVPERLLVQRALFRSLAVLGALALVAAAYFGTPWFVVRESIARGDATSVPNGERDRLFVADGWSAPHEEGITVRVAVADRATVRFPLPARRDYDLVIRMDPIEPVDGQRVSVLFNRQFVARLTLTWNPERVGSYRFTVRERAVQAGSNEVTLIPETRIRAADAGPRFSWLEPATLIGLRFWYLRVLP